MSSLLPPPGHAVQIISLIDPIEPGRNNRRFLKLDLHTLKDITNKAGSLPVAVIAIAGPGRGGKSFSLSYIVRFLSALEKSGSPIGRTHWTDAGDWMEKNNPNLSIKDKCFQFQNGTERQTDGIMIWSRPFIIQTTDPLTPDTPKQIAVLLLDTEGCFDAFSSEAEESAIIGLSLLTSSTFIFNESKKINENTLTTLARFMQYGQLAVQTFQAKCFQQIMFLVRDWNFPTKFEYGAAGGKSFIQEYLSPKPRMSEGALTSRRLIEDCFEDTNCYLMPHPGEKVLSENFTGSIGEMEENFRDHVEFFTKSLIEFMTLKKIGATVVATGDSFCKIFAQYVDAFNSEDMPSPQSILKATMYSVYECHILELISVFRETLTRGLESQKVEVAHILPERVEKIFTKSKNLVMEKFDKLREFTEPQIKEISRRQLIEKIEQVCLEKKNEVQLIKNKMVEDAEGQGILKFEESMRGHLGQGEFVLFSDEQFNLFGEASTRSALDVFFATCRNPGKQFSNLIVPQFLEKLKTNQETFWRQLENRRQAVTGHFKAKIATWRETYQEKMDIVVDEDYIESKKLANSHQKYLDLSLRDYSNEFKNSKYSPELIAQFRQELQENIQQDFQKIEGENLNKFKLIQDKVQVIIQDSVDAFTQKSEEILEEGRVALASEDQLIEIHDKIRDVAFTCLEDQVEHLVNVRNLNKFKYQLVETLERELQNSKEALATNVQWRESQCQEIVESSYVEFCQKIQEVLKTEPYFETLHLESQIETLSKQVQKSNGDGLSQLNFEDSAIYQSQLDELVKGESQRILNENNLIKQKIDRTVKEAVEEIRFNYQKVIEKHIEKSIPELEAVHNEHMALVLEKFNDRTMAMGHQNLRVVQESRQNLENELEAEFEKSKKVIQNRLDLLDQGLAQAKEEVGRNYERKFKKSIEENPFLNDSDFDSHHDRISLDELTEFKKTIKKFVSSRKSIKITVEELKTALENKKQIFKDFAQEQKEEGLKKMDEVSKICLDSFNQSFESIFDSSSPDVESILRQLVDDTCDQFDEKCPPFHGDEKDKIKKQLEKEMHQKVRQVKEEKLNKINLLEETINKLVTTLLGPIQDDLEKDLIFDLENLQQNLTSLSEQAQTQMVEILQEQKMDASGLDQLKTAMTSKCEALRVLQFENEEKLKSKFKEVTEEFSKSKKNEIKSRKDLENFETELKSKVFAEVTSLVGPDQEIPEEIEKLANQYFEECYNKIVQELMTVSEGKTEEIIKMAVENYNKEMASYLQSGFAVNPEALRLFSQQSIEQCLKQIGRRHIIISKGQKSLIKNRLVNTYRIFTETNNLKAAESQNFAIGIDLGTTTSCVAIYQNGKAVVMKDGSGRTLTPSYVYFPDSGSPMIGHEAKDKAQREPENVIFDAKRLIGRQYRDPVVQEDAKIWPFEVIDDGAGRPNISVRGRAYTPEEISAQVLIRMKEIAFDTLQVPVTKAVITVPANFNDSQRDATRQAAQVAGLEVLQIINEPTAAAMAHALIWKDEERIVLVYDFGGGTFDVSILKTGSNSTVPAVTPEDEEGACGGQIEPRPRNSGATGKGLTVLSTLGDTHLGGEDMDQNLVLFCVAEFEKINGIKLLEKTTTSAGTANPNSPLAVNRRLRRLKDACEKVKTQLTAADTGTVALDAIFGALDLDVEISRAKFEELNEHLFQRAIDCVKKAIEDAKIDKTDITDILMVGGSSRIPRVRKLLADFLMVPTIHIDQKIDIQEAVALGAAVQACCLNGQDLASKLPVVQDVQPFTLGVEVKGRKMSEIIKRNSSIPTQAMQSYCTSVNNQRSVDIVIYSGEGEMVEDNEELGKFVLTEIPPGPKGSQEIQVRMKIDASGILNVTATCMSTGGSQNLVIEESRGRLTEGQIKEMRKRANDI